MKNTKLNTGKIKKALEQIQRELFNVTQLEPNELTQKLGLDYYATWKMNVVVCAWIQLKKEVIFPKLSVEEFVNKEYSQSFLEEISPYPEKETKIFVDNVQKFIAKKVLGGSTPKDKIGNSFMWELIKIYEYENLKSEFPAFMEENLPELINEEIKALFFYCSNY